MEKLEEINAGRILVCGTQAGGKTAIVTKLAQRTNRQLEFQEDFGGTIETEYLKVAFDEGRFFSLLLPIGGQEKWSKLRTSFGSTAEAMVVIVDSCTKSFWMNSLQQAISISSVLPYNNYPVAFVVTKRDLNEMIRREAENIGETIIKGIESAQHDEVKYYSRGFRVTERSFTIYGDEIPFSQLEQIIANSLEQKYFTGLIPGNAKKGKMLLPGFTLVNCRIFSRALTLGISQPYVQGDSMSILALLNDMRPTMLELDSNWENLARKYPNAGSEPRIPIDELSTEVIKDVILDKLLANNNDINNFETEINKISDLTGWNPVGWGHLSVFEEEGLDQAAELVKQIMKEIANSEQSAKFTLFNPLEELF
ncbi:MAG: ADP-ribosylation factor-like protein [Candidatus Hodarchaeales archaeon]